MTSRDAVNKLPALGCAVLGKFDVFVNGYLHRDIRKGGKFSHGHEQNNLIGQGQAIHLPVFGIAGDKFVIVRFELRRGCKQFFNEILVFIPIERKFLTAQWFSSSSE